MTRWGCKVVLDRGVPVFPPDSHGWPVRRSGARRGDVVLCSTATVRYVCCHACHRWVPEGLQAHACTAPPSLEVGPLGPVGPVGPVGPDADAESSSSSSSSSSGARASVYVVSTEENFESLVCPVCSDRMRMQYMLDVEDWVFMDCVEHDGVVMHEECRDCAFGR
ncbi:unnamed protein product [Pylaiella littoralis]